MTQSGSNGLDPKLVKQFTADIQRLEAEIDVFKAEHMARCKRQRELINGMYDRARDSGIPVKALKTEIKAMKLEAKADSLRQSLEDDDAESLEMIIAALGDLADLPLGDAALKRASVVDSLVADEDPAEAHIAANVTKLTRGIQPIA